MSILSLSTENKDKLLQLIESLQEVFEQKDILIEKAEPFVNRMKEITLEKENLDKKSEKYDITNFKSTTDATDLSNIILKSKQLDEEINSINASSRSLNIEFDEIINQENEIISKIKELVELSTKNNDQIKESILVDKLGINVFVIKPNIPDVISVVDRGADEIINCEADIAKSLSEVYFENSIEITKKVDKDDFKELEKYFLASKEQKEQSIDERLAFIQKDNKVNDEEKTNVELVSEILSREVPTQDIIIKSTSEPIKLDIISQEQEQDNKNNIEQSENKNTILSLDSILQENKNDESKAIDSNIIIIKDKFDNSHSKVANSNKEKLQNIINNFKGTFVLPIIKSEIVQNVGTKPVDPISNFINPKAA